MATTFGEFSSSDKMGFDDKKEGVLEEVGDVSGTDAERNVNKGIERLCRQMSENSFYATEDEEDDDGARKIEKDFELGPQLTLKEQLEKDKDDESLWKWKKQLLGSVDLNSVGENMEPDVKILSISILSPGRDELFLPLPAIPTSEGLWFTLKEGSTYCLKLSFLVSNNIVPGLSYSNTVWKSGIKVDSTREMIGTFSPQAEPYTHVLAEDVTPSGFLARGTYSARTRFVDDDQKCHLEINYSFSIRKDWIATS